MIHYLIFFLGVHPRSGDPQWKSMTKNGRVLYLPDANGPQPSEEEPAWKVEEVHTDHFPSGFRIIRVRLLEPIPRSEDDFYREGRPRFPRRVPDPTHHSASQEA